MQHFFFRKTSPLYWAVNNCRTDCIVMMFLAGVPVTRRTLRSFSKNLTVMRNPILVNWMFCMITKPRSLQDLCRLCIRKSLYTHNPGKGIFRLIRQLSTPDKLKSYLSFKTDEHAIVLAQIMANSPSP